MGTYIHKMTDNPVVIKLHDKERDLAREVSILKKLGRGEHWIMYEYYHDKSPLEETYLVLERYGESLDSFLRKVSMNNEHKRAVMGELCRAIHALHQKGAAHDSNSSIHSYSPTHSFKA